MNCKKCGHSIQNHGTIGNTKGKCLVPICSCQIPYVQGKYVYLGRDDRDLITLTPHKECWICEELCKHMVSVSNDLFKISLSWLVGNDFIEHLEQIIGEFEQLVEE